MGMSVCPSVRLGLLNVKVLATNESGRPQVGNLSIQNRKSSPVVIFVTLTFNIQNVDGHSNFAFKSSTERLRKEKIESDYEISTRSCFLPKKTSPLKLSN